MNFLAQMTQRASTIKSSIPKLFFSKFDSTQRTPLLAEAADDKEDKIDYINASQPTLTRAILATFTDITLYEYSVALVDDIFLEGVVIRYVLDGVNDKRQNALQILREHPANECVYVSFRTHKGNPYERLYLLAAEAQVKQGILDGIVSLLIPSDDAKQTFTVIHTRYITQNMLRVAIKSESALPVNNPGYAYRFRITRSNSGRHLISANILKHARRLLQAKMPGIMRLSFAKHVTHQIKKRALLLILAGYKRLPDKERRSAQPLSVVQRRYYTLRQLSTNHDDFSGEIDIYIHDKTQGSEWAKSLHTGDQIEVDSHYEETIKDMTIGQPLFICDETSMPSVAAVLEQWHHCVVPIVIHLTNQQAEVAYFDEIRLPTSLHDKLYIDHIVTSEIDDIAQAVINTIEQHDKIIDCAWGALGKAYYRPIKMYLRQNYGLKGRLNRIRAYWA